jgi:hypothetical protein
LPIFDQNAYFRWHERQKTPSKDRSGNVAAITGRRSSTYHLSIHAAITGRRSSTYHLFIHAATIDRRHISSQSQKDEAYALWRRSRRSAPRPPNVTTVGSGTAVSVTNFE